MAIAFAVAIVGYYWFAAPRVATLAGPLTKYLPPLGDITYSSAESILKLALAGLFQLAFCLVLIGIAGFDRRDLGAGACPAVLLVFGVVLGVGEMALASFLGFATTRLVDAVQRDPVGNGIETWLAMSRSGWMRQYLRTVESAPWPIAVSLVVLYVGVEEVMFRSLILRLWQEEPRLALTISVGLFSLVQQFNMPSWRHGLFPFVGGLTMGIIHGILFLKLPFVAPLILAHLSFFGTAVLTRHDAARPAR